MAVGSHRPKDLMDYLTAAEGVLNREELIRLNTLLSDIVNVFIDRARVRKELALATSKLKTEAELNFAMEQVTSIESLASGIKGQGNGSDAGAGNQPAFLGQPPLRQPPWDQQAVPPDNEPQPIPATLKRGEDFPEEMNSLAQPASIDKATNEFLTAGLPLHQEEELTLNLELGEQYLFNEPSTTADKPNYPVGTVFRCKPRSFITDLQVDKIVWEDKPIVDKEGKEIARQRRHVYHCHLTRNARKQMMTEADLMRYMYCWYVPSTVQRQPNLDSGTQLI